MSRLDAETTHAPLILAKLREQVERADHLIGLVPPGKLDWRPDVPGGAFSVRELLEHLLESLAGFCAALYALHPGPLAHFQELRQRGTKAPADNATTQRRLREYLVHIEEGFALLTDADLARSIPTVFVPGGEPVLTILLGNLEHLVNHKHQLFFYVKLLGVAAGTPDLYHLRGSV